MSTAASRRERGPTFTLIETIVAIAVLALLAGVLTPMFGRQVTDMKVSRAIVACRRVCAALASYNDERGQFPPGLQGDPSDNFADSNECGFGAEILNTWLFDGTRKYIAKAIERDPWGCAFNYRVFARDREYFHVVVFSNGPNRACDSWERTRSAGGDFGGDDVGAFIDVRR